MRIEKVILLLTLLICINLSAQETTKTQTLFVRVFDLDGKKIGKGHIYATNDSLLILNKNKKLKKLYVKEIGKIKTKRSGGQNVLVGAASGVVAGAILGSLNTPTDSSGGTFTWAGSSSGEEFSSGLTFGIISGTIIGGISAVFKNSKSYIINANPEKWKVFVEATEHNTENRN